MKIRLYLDEDAMDADLVHALRIRGVNVTTALEQGMIRRDQARSGAMTLIISSLLLHNNEPCTRLT